MHGADLPQPGTINMAMTRGFHSFKFMMLAHVNMENRLETTSNTHEHHYYAIFTVFAYNESTTLPTCSRVWMAAPYVFYKVLGSGAFIVERGRDTHIHLRLVEDEQTSSALVENTVEDLVQNHL